MTIARRLPTLVMPAKRASTSSAASVAKRPRLDLAPISPFTVDALKQALIDADPSTDGKEPRLVDLLELELTKMDPTWLKALHNE